MVRGLPPGGALAACLADALSLKLLGRETTWFGDPKFTVVRSRRIIPGSALFQARETMPRRG